MSETSRNFLPNAFVQFITVYYSIIISYITFKVMDQIPQIRTHSVQWVSLWLSIFITYAIVVPSFIHYQLSIRRWMYISNFLGVLRFCLDIVIVSTYSALVRALHNPILFTGLVATIFFLYVVWDSIRVREYYEATYPEETVRELRKRERINYRFYTIVYTLFVATSFIPQAAQATLTLIAVTQLLYRYTKMRHYLAAR